MDKLYIEKLGRGSKKFLFLPGITGTVNYWKPYLQPYISEGEFILVDPLGFGRSPKPNIKYTIENHINYLYKSIKAEGGPFTIVGHSMGSLLAIHFAHKYSDLVEKLVLIGVPAFKSKKQAKRHFYKQLRFSVTTIPIAAAACVISRIVIKYFSPILKRTKMWDSLMIDDMLMHTWKSYTSSLWEVVYQSDIFNISHDIPKSIPVICLHGTKDKSAPLLNLKELIDNNNWEIYIQPTGTHSIFIENPKWCMEYILSH
ncbi:alpha/beta hydrolase [Aeribacillus pallidus]|nr:alpha/beta hydrolase [Aeribacillus pallidus]